MKTNYLIIVTAFTCFFGRVNAQSPNWQWAKSIGGTDHDYGNSIAIDASGNIYTTGTFSGTVDFDPGPGTYNLTSAGVMAIFISKMDSSGNFVWAQQFSGTNGVKAASESIIIDASGNVYTTGHFQGTYDFNPGLGTFNLYSSQRGIFISKLDSSGNFVWARQMSGANDAYGYAIALDAWGNIYTTGGFVGTVDFDPGVGIFNLTAPTSLNNYPSDIFISKLDHAGNFIWAKAMGGIHSQMGLSIAIDNAGSGAVYTTGYFQGTVDFDPGVGVFNLTGPYVPQFFVSNIFISRLDSAGNFVWAKRLGESAGRKGNSIATDTFGNVYTTGNFAGVGDFDPGMGTFNLTSAGSDDIFISKLDNTGNFVWAKAMGGTDADVGRSIAIDPAGTGALYTAGSFSGTADFDPGVGTFNFTSAGNVDIFISKLDNSGNFIWAKAAGGSTIDYGQSVALDASGSAYVAGYFRSPSIMFDAMTFANADNTGSTSDIFIAKLDATVFTANNEIGNASKEVLLFPNPATNNLTLAFASNTMKIEVCIIDITGKIIYKTSAIDVRKIEVNTADLAAGVYVVQIQTGDFIETKKLVVEK